MSTKIQPLNAVLTYMGRIELYGGFPRFVFAGTSVTIRFKGTDCACVIRNHRFYNKMSLGVVTDGKVTRVDFEHSDEDIRIVLAEGLENTDHELTLYKRQDATHYFEFKGFELDDCAELLPAKPVPKRRMECFGDSVFSTEMVIATLEYSDSHASAYLHKFTLLRILDRHKEDVDKYHFLVNPEEHPQLFTSAA